MATDEEMIAKIDEALSGYETQHAGIGGLGGLDGGVDRSIEPTNYSEEEEPTGRGVYVAHGGDWEQMESPYYRSQGAGDPPLFIDVQRVEVEGVWLTPEDTQADWTVVHNLSTDPLTGCDAREIAERIVRMGRPHPTPQEQLGPLRDPEELADEIAHEAWERRNRRLWLEPILADPTEEPPSAPGPYYLVTSTGLVYRRGYEFHEAAPEWVRRREQSPPDDPERLYHDPPPRSQLDAREWSNRVRRALAENEEEL